jgi:SAM-dependent methyltransferase
VRRTDGSAGDADYAAIGDRYSHYRQPDPRLAGQIHAAIGHADLVLNVGAGAGSYEPSDRSVVAVEPSAAMRAQRAAGLGPAVEATAEALPFGDDTFAAAMATFTVHQWPDLAAGLSEMRRVSRGSVVVLTCDPALLERFWLAAYAPEVIATEARRYPPVPGLLEGLGGGQVRSVAIPLDCVDGFGEAYYGRPEALLDPGARRANSAWSFVDHSVHERFEAELRADLDSGAWDRRYGHLRELEQFEGSLVLIVSGGDHP